MVMASPEQKEKKEITWRLRQRFEKRVGVVGGGGGGKPTLLFTYVKEKKYNRFVLELKRLKKEGQN